MAEVRHLAVLLVVSLAVMVPNWEKAVQAVVECRSSEDEVLAGPVAWIARMAVVVDVVGLYSAVIGAAPG